MCLSKSDKRWLGAGSASLNTAEISAMLEALLWLETEAPGGHVHPATIYYDSSYAFQAVTGSSLPEENVALVFQARAIWQRVSALREISIVHVKGHSGNVGNDHADHLAGKGASGLQTKQSARWLLPFNSPSPVSPLFVDHCWRCGRVFSGPSYARQLAGHEGQCKTQGAPPESIPCRHGCGKVFAWKFTRGESTKPGHLTREGRNLHGKNLSRC